jgi:hypothetical protein
VRGVARYLNISNLFITSSVVLLWYGRGEAWILRSQVMQVALGMDAGQSGDCEWVGSRRMHV